jgi:predicted pyridoxine 5'-phosphate oxidase superfamily flavin-nucleotide-binding protein
MKFHQGEIAVQTLAGVRNIAEDVGDGIHERIPESAGDFLSLRNMAVIGGVDPSGRVWASV